MNGVELCEKIRAEGFDTPFILFTCHDDERVIESALTAGVDHHLRKEPNLAIFNELVHQIRRLVSSR